MKHGRRVKITVQLFIISILAVLPIVASVGAPRQINYQGMLTDNTGTPLNGTYLVSFYLYQVETEGTSLWEEESQTIEVNNGIFSVQIGSANPLSINAFDYEALYLEVAIANNDGSSYEILSPRQRLTTVAYAFNSEQLNGNTLADLDARYVNVGQSGIITSAMIQDGQVSSWDIADNSVTATDLQTGAVLTDILKEDGSGSGLDADLIDGHDSSEFASNVHFHNQLSAQGGSPPHAVYVNSSGRVGIGTTSPGSRL